MQQLINEKHKNCPVLSVFCFKNIFSIFINNLPQTYIHNNYSSFQTNNRLNKIHHSFDIIFNVYKTSNNGGTVATNYIPTHGEPQYDGIK